MDEQAELSARDNMQAEEDYELFMQELDADKEMRGTVNLYTSTRKKGAANQRAVDDADSEGAVGDNYDDDDDVRLDELLDGLELSGVAGGGGASNIVESSLLSAEDAAKVAAVALDTEGFNAATFDPKDFKFT